MGKNLRFYSELGFFSIFFILSLTCIMFKRKYFDSLVNEHSNVANSTGAECIEVTREYTRSMCHCIYLQPNDSNRYVIIIFFKRLLI